MSSCVGLLLECVASALAGIGIIGLCWRARLPLRLAQRYDATITDKGMYGALPIYGYLRRYFSILLLAACVVVLVCTVLLIHIGLEWPKCADRADPKSVTQTVLIILSLFLSIHMTTIATFETIKRRHKEPYPIKTLVENVRKRLWGVAVFLVLAIGLVAIVEQAVN